MIPSWPYLHTLINHFPIVLGMIGTLALLLALVYPRRGLWLYALGTLTLAGITVYPAWLTGDEAADVVRNAWYIPAGSIRQHAQAATVTMWILLALGLASLVAWASIVRAREAFAPARWLRIVVSVLAVAGFIAISYTGYRGGQIVVDSAILASPTPPVPPAPAPGTQPAATQLPTQPPAAQPLGQPMGQPMQTPLPPVRQQVPQPQIQPPRPRTQPTTQSAPAPQAPSTH